MDRFEKLSNPSVPPILISDIVEVRNIFNEVFASQSTPLKNNSKLTTLLINTDKRLHTVSIKKDDITLTIKPPNPTKAHEFDNISVRMIQLCGNSIALPLVQTFKFSLRQGIFLNTWKMANIIPVHKKEAKYFVKNYRPISLLPTFAKIFERLLFNSIFSRFHNNNLFTKCQSGFMPGDSCLSQPLFIVPEIQSSCASHPLM